MTQNDSVLCHGRFPGTIREDMVEALCNPIGHSLRIYPSVYQLDHIKVLYLDPISLELGP